MPTVHIGLSPTEAVAAFALTEPHRGVKIKVPRGLPDPTPYLPKDNLPTVGKWELGRDLFFESQLQADQGPYKCATCHQPGRNYTETLKSHGGKYNTPTLINVVYNRRQFWDGRVETLEETIVRGKLDERENDPQRSEKALLDHNWGGFARSLTATKQYNARFKQVFGVDHPTQDTVAKALATYMRTLLSGDSIVDRAQQASNGKKLAAEHFLEVLKDEKALAAVQDWNMKRRSAKEVADVLVLGSELFHNKGRCAQCHTGKLYTDQDYHNVGYPGNEGEPDRGTETGRAVHVAVGRKEARFLGAFRTPSLRNLVNTGPYFHNGVHFTLPKVVEFYSQNVGAARPLEWVAATLRDPRREPLTADEQEAVVMFLHALEGTPVEPSLTIDLSRLVLRPGETK
jgi:cytochrome c peroxidase